MLRGTGYGVGVPRTTDRGDVPTRLLNAGVTLFLRQGYNATGIQEITEEAGVPKGSFYNHFASKEAFAAAIVDRYAAYSLRSWHRMMRSAPAEPLATIRHVFTHMLAYHERTEVSSGCLVGNLAAEIALWSEPCRQSLLAAQLAWRQRLAGLIAVAQVAGEVRGDIEAGALAGLAWNAWEGALLRVKMERSIRPLCESTALILDHLFRPLPAAPQDGGYVGVRTHHV